MKHWQRVSTEGGTMDHIVRRGGLDGPALCGRNPWPGTWELALTVSRLCIGCVSSVNAKGSR